MDHFCWGWWLTSAGFCMSSLVYSTGPCLIYPEALKTLFMLHLAPEMPLLASLLIPPSPSSSPKLSEVFAYGSPVSGQSPRDTGVLHEFPGGDAPRLHMVIGRAETCTRLIWYHPLYVLPNLRTSIHINAIKFQYWHPGNISGRAHSSVKDVEECIYMCMCVWMYIYYIYIYILLFSTYNCIIVLHVLIKFLSMKFLKGKLIFRCASLSLYT